ncbi:hypothetical protein KIN20_003646 [Parelaphostrongylus tenuis]|uniref:Uncharacterized protein n=1 Tax=Parelaphostrongylus tenuis TaxID=148309 RepID=A0AAD5QEK1_PARTN|nr:hypothetical protein KIN20_003646 [Parelaphostrongylus tenuis]
MTGQPNSVVRASNFKQNEIGLLPVKILPVSKCELTLPESSICISQRPAKEVARSGSELLQKYQSLQESFDHYMQAIDTLIRSSKKAFPKAQAHGDDLRELAEKTTQILEQHKKCVRELSSFVTRTNAYSKEEKDKLKGMINKYERDEKEIRKQCKKGLKTTTELNSFIEMSADEFIRQQELRYKFFLEKHKNWLSTYSSLSLSLEVKNSKEEKTGAGDTTSAHAMNDGISETRSSLTASVDTVSKSDQVTRGSPQPNGTVNNSSRSSTTEMLGAVTAKTGSLSFIGASSKVTQEGADSTVRISPLPQNTSDDCKTARKLEEPHRTCLLSSDDATCR